MRYASVHRTLKSAIYFLWSPAIESPDSLMTKKYRAAPDKEAVGIWKIPITP